MRHLLLYTTILSFSISLNAQFNWDYFDKNSVEALISPVANHFWDYDNNHYYVPKDSGTTSIFTSTFWIGGMDVGGQLHFAGERFRQVGYDFTPGPVSDSLYYNPPYNDNWNRVWKVDRSDLDQWLSNPYGNPVPQVVLDWPAHGDTAKGQAYNLAPFVDVDGDGVYDPVNDFDHPAIKGDQAVYFIFNDDATLHTETGGQKLSVEIHGMAYGFSCPNDTALDRALFMEYTIHNRSDMDYNDAFIGLWNDFDLGNPQDDYIGSDPLRNLFYAYNGDLEDENAQGNIGYGTNLPAQGLRVLRGPKLEDDGMDNQPSLQFDGNYNGFGMDDGITDNEYTGLYSFVYHNNAAGPTGDPSIATDYYNMMRAVWKDGTQMTYGGNGYDPGNPNAIPARFMFTGNSDSVFLSTAGIDPGNGNALWTEVTAGNTTGDRRGLGGIGPFTLEAGEQKSLEIAYVFAQKEGDNYGAVEKMKDYSDHLQELFENQTTDCGDFQKDYTGLIGIEDASSADQISVHPNPAENQFRVVGLSENSAFSLHALSGQVVKSGSLSVSSNSVDVGDLDAGIYFLSISVNGNDTVEKIVIQ